MAINIMSTTITLTWAEVPAIDQNGVIISYEVEYNQTTFNSVPTTQNGTVNSTMAVLAGLEEYVEYFIRVRAYTEEGPGPYSDVINVTTDQDSEFVKHIFDGTLASLSSQSHMQLQSTL